MENVLSPKKTVNSWNLGEFGRISKKFVDSEINLSQRSEKKQSLTLETHF